VRVLDPCWLPAVHYAIDCGNCQPVDDHPDLRGHQPDPAHGDGPAAAEIASWSAASRSSPTSRRHSPRGRTASSR